MAKEVKMHRLLDYMLYLVVGAVLILGILLGSGALKSGYHFLDDHELIRMEYSLENGGAKVGELTLSTIQNDLRSRFRPFYWVERVGCTAIFGSELLYWNIYTAIKGILTFMLLAATAGNLRFSRPISLLFAGIIMLGPQFTPWFRSANQENTGLLLCALCLWLISARYRRGRYGGKLWNLFLCSSIVLCGLVKESFTLFMPAFLAFQLWLQYTEGKNTLKQCIRENLWMYLVTGIIFLNHIYWILFRVGVDNVSYAGFQEETRLSEYFYGIKDSLMVYLKWYTLIAVLLVVMLVVCYQVVDKSRLVTYIGFALIGGGAMGVQLVAHAKSLMWERYIIPFIIAYAMIFVLLGYRIFEKDSFRLKVYVGVLAVLLLLEAPVAYEKSEEYARDGRMIREMFTYILANTDEDSIIVGAFSDGELNGASACYLEVNGRTKEYEYYWDSGELKDNVQMVAANSQAAKWQQVEITMCYLHQVDAVMKLMGGPAAENVQWHEFGEYFVVSRTD